MKAAKQPKNLFPTNIDGNIVKGIQIPVGKFKLRLLPIITPALLVIALILLPMDMNSQGSGFYTGKGIFAWLFHASIFSIIITGMIRGLFKYEVNEFGIKCFNLKGGTWFIEWDNFEIIEERKFLWLKYISIQPSDNYDRFAIIKGMEDYDLFKALCYKLSKNKQELIKHL